MKRQFLAVCLLLCLLLGGCGIVQIPGDTTSVTTSGSTTPSGGTPPSPTDRNATILENRKAAIEALADIDLGGNTFVIATTTPNRYAPAVDASDTISVAAFARNEELKNRFHASIVTEAYESASQLFDAARTASMSGLYLADLYAIPYSQVGTYVAHGLLSSVYDLPFLDTSSFVFHREITTQSVIGTEAYAICTTAEYAPSEYPAVYFASSVTDYLDIDPYALLTQGKWTWNALYDIADTATKAGFTGYALAQSPSLALNLPELVVRTAATHPVTNVHGECPTLDYGMRQTKSIFSLVQQVGSLFHAPEPVDRTLFQAGGVLFYFDTLDGMSALTADAYGLLPIPKYSHTQGSYTTMPTQHTQVLVLPAATTQSPASTGKFLACYAATSYGCFRIAQTDAWLRDTLREEQALLSIHYILSATVRADLSDCFGSISYPTIAGDPIYSTLAERLTAGTRDLLSPVFDGTVSPNDAVSALEAKNKAFQAFLRQHFPFA